MASRYRYWLGALLVLLVAAVLRLAAIHHLPIGLHYDEAANNILTQGIAFEGDRPIFIRAYTGKEVLFFYLGALWFRLVGAAPWVLRLNGAVIGLLAVAATGAAARALRGPGPEGRRMALFAAAGMAVLLPHVILSRYGFRAVSQSLMEALTVAALWRGLRTGRWPLLLAAGLFLGLTGYTYLAARLFPIPLALAMGWLLLRASGPARRRYIFQLTVVLAAAALVFAPLGLFFIRNPDAFTVRVAQVAAPAGREVMEGFWRCVLALGWPGAGASGARFNVPSHPVLEWPVALLALSGILFLFLRRPPDPLAAAGRVLLLTALPVMLLPSALATRDDVPNHMRLIGAYPFLVMLPAVALSEIVRRLPARVRSAAGALALVFILGWNGAVTGGHYLRWARSPALFDASDGDMVLLARALDRLDLEGTTAYVASVHYRHPTVAALSRRYNQVKWLTGGATLVLPPEGGAVYLVPVSARPPFPWPEELSSRWSVEEIRDPFGRPALWVYRLSANAVAALRPPGPPAADFAHVVRVHSAVPLGDCAAGRPCGVLVTWEVRAPYPALQPVVRLSHPQTGEWARVHPFHYPTGEWTVGEVVLDQQVLFPPPGIPPVDGYEIAVGFFHPDTLEVLPRVGPDEEFAGLEVTFPLGTIRFPAGEGAVPALPPACSPAPEEIQMDGVRLLGWSSVPASLRPGERLSLTLCWRSLTAPLPDRPVRLWLDGPTQAVLYQNAPVYGRLPFPVWAEGMTVEDRLSVRLPREMPPGEYGVYLAIGPAEPVRLGTLTVSPLERTFAAPTPRYPLEADFGQEIRLLGYELGEVRAGETLSLVLYWQARREMEEDYTVFVHLIDPQSGTILAQVDEMPRHGDYPTSLWVKGEVVRDEHALPLPALPAGSYALRVGLYLQETGRRLPVGEGNFLLLPLGVQD